MGRDDISHNPVAPSVLQISDALNGVVEALGKNSDSVGMQYTIARRVGPADEILEDLAKFEFFSLARNERPVQCCKQQS